MSQRGGNANRKAYEIIILFTTLCGLDLAAELAWDRQVALLATAVFAIPCAVVTARPRKMVVALAPLLLVPTSIFSVGTALLAIGLLTIGQFCVVLPVSLVGFAINDWRADRSRFGHAVRVEAIRDLAGGPMRFLTALVIVALTAHHADLQLAVLVLAPAALFWKGRTKWTAVTAFALSALFGWHLAPLALAMLAALLELIAISARPPRQRLPLPRPHPLRQPLTWARAIRCDAYLSRGDVIGARRVVSKTDGRDPYLHLRLVYIDLEERSYQSGLAIAHTMPSSLERLRPYVAIVHARALSGTAQFQQARAIFDRLLRETEAARDLYAICCSYAAANELDAGDTAAARRLADEALSAFTGSATYVERLRAVRLVAAAVELDGDVAAAAEWSHRITTEMVSTRWGRRLWFRDDDGTQLMKLISGRRNGLHVEWVRATLVSARLSDMGGTDDPCQPTSDMVPFVLALAHCWDDLVDYLLRLADVANRRGEHAQAATLGCRALMDLDRTRYSLAAQSARTSWSKRLERAMAITLDAAYCDGDRRLQAELIEFARVQTLPSANGELVGDTSLETPPVVRVQGRTRLGRPTAAPRPPAVDIERAAEQAAGSGAWWLSFWEAGGWLYWALTPDDGTSIQAGRSSMAADSEVSQSLQQLREALPAQLAGEDAVAAMFRYAASPLLCSPEREASLAVRLGKCLIPARLVAAARWHGGHHDRPLPLAIAPSASLGQVPWSLLAMVAGGRASGEVCDRVIELCDWVLAPSAALLCRSQQTPRRPAPLTVAVADTCVTSDLGPLEGARRQAVSLSAGVSVLGGRHWTGAVATLSELEARLREQHGPFTLSFMCHAVRGTFDEPSNGGVVMAPKDGDGFDILRPSTILTMARRNVPMPAQVLLQACDTSAISDTGSGEWLTVAPAFIAAGTREIIATLYPLLDAPDADDPLLRAARSGDGLWQALRDHQRGSLQAWIAAPVDDPARAPITWAAYAPVGLASIDRPPSEGASMEHDRVRISRRCLTVIARATGAGGWNRRLRLDSAALLAWYLEMSDLARVIDGSPSIWRISSFLWSLGPWVLHDFLHIRDRRAGDISVPGPEGRDAAVSDSVVKAIARAAAVARNSGTPIEPEHILIELLESPSAARRVFSILNALTRRHAELTLRALRLTLSARIASPPGNDDQPLDSAKVELAMALLQGIAVDADLVFPALRGDDWPDERGVAPDVVSPRRAPITGITLVRVRNRAHEVASLGMRCDRREVPEPMGNGESAVGTWIGLVKFRKLAIETTAASEIEISVDGAVALTVTADRAIGIVMEKSARKPAVWFSHPLACLDARASEVMGGVDEDRPRSVRIYADTWVADIFDVARLTKERGGTNTWQEASLLAALNRARA